MYQTQELANVVPSGTLLSISALKVTVFLYKEVEGLTLVDEISEFVDQDPDQFVLKLGFSYFASIGQGNEYHCGFYGPLPVPHETEYVSFVFASLVPDRAQCDPRADSKSYVLACLLCGRSQVPKFIDRSMIEAAFEDMFAALGDVREIDGSFTNCLKTILIDASK